MTSKGLTERRSLQVIGMSASALRYHPRADRNGVLRQKIVALAQRHRRYGAEMIYLKLRQAGELVNHKRVERLYALEKLQVKRRRRKKIPVSERQPLIRPGAANEVWSADFVFDRVASGRMLKCLVIVDDATHESIAIVVEHCMGGNHLTRVLDGICSQRGRPAVIRTDNVLRTEASYFACNKHPWMQPVWRLHHRIPRFARLPYGLPLNREILADHNEQKVHRLTKAFTGPKTT